MDNKACKKGQPAAKKGKTKQVKGELDRIKQAEKKKRRLEKALATSAAIRAELEKKKEKKKDEQRRLDEEGAAISEAVALHVLLDEDSDDLCSFKPLGYAGNTGLLIGCQQADNQLQETRKYPPRDIRLLFGANISGPNRASFGQSNWSCSTWPHERDLHMPYFEQQARGLASLHYGLQRMHM